MRQGVLRGAPLPLVVLVACSRCSCFKVSSPSFTWYTGIAHMISVLEWRGLMHDYAIGIAGIGT